MGQGSISALATVYTVLPGPFYTLEANSLPEVECPVSVRIGEACWNIYTEQDSVSCPHPKVTHVLQR